MVSSTSVIDEGEKEGMQIWNICGTIFELPQEYQITDPMGVGAYGVVVSAKDNSVKED